MEDENQTPKTPFSSYLLSQFPEAWSVCWCQVSDVRGPAADAMMKDHFEMTPWSHLDQMFR